MTGFSFAVDKKIIITKKSRTKAVGLSIQIYELQFQEWIDFLMLLVRKTFMTYYYM